MAAKADVEIQIVVRSVAVWRTQDASFAPAVTSSERQALKRGRVRIGANESTSLYLLPHLILGYRAKYPDVMVEISRHTSETLPREVLDRNVDFALLAHEPLDSQLESFLVLRDPLVLILYPEHPLATRNSVTIEELGSEPFLAHNVKTGSRRRVMEAFAAHHPHLNITLELATVETIKRFVQLRVGIAFAPRMCVEEELERGTLVETIGSKTNLLTVEVERVTSDALKSIETRGQTFAQSLVSNSSEVARTITSAGKFARWAASMIASGFGAS